MVKYLTVLNYNYTFIIRDKRLLPMLNI